MRIDLFHGDDVPWTNKITVTKVVASEADADLEVARLTELNRGKGCVYFWQVTKIYMKP